MAFILSRPQCVDGAAGNNNLHPPNTEDMTIQLATFRLVFMLFTHIGAAVEAGNLMLNVPSGL